MSGVPKCSLMLNSDLSPVPPMGRRDPPTWKTCVVSTRMLVLTNWVSSWMLQPSNELVVTNFCVPSDFLVEEEEQYFISITKNIIISVGI